MGQPSMADLAARCAAIELLVVDVDGVLTDGIIALDDRGVETKHFHVRDGLAYRALASGRQAVGDPVWPSSGGCRPASRRAGDRHVAQGLADKAGPLRALLAELKSGPAPGLLCGRRSGRPAGAGLGGSGRLSRRRGGRGTRRGSSRHSVAGWTGAVREVIEVVLKAQGLWHGLCTAYSVPAV